MTEAKQMKLLDESAQDLKYLPLLGHSLTQLHIRLAHCMWKDGAEWPVVLEFWNDTRSTREEIINILKERFDL